MWTILQNMRTILSMIYSSTKMRRLCAYYRVLGFTNWKEFSLKNLNKANMPNTLWNRFFFNLNTAQKEIEQRLRNSLLLQLQLRGNFSRFNMKVYYILETLSFFFYCGFRWCAFSVAVYTSFLKMRKKQ